MPNNTVSAILHWFQKWSESPKFSISRLIISIIHGNGYSTGDIFINGDDFNSELSAKGK